MITSVLVVPNSIEKRSIIQIVTLSRVFFLRLISFTCSYFEFLLALWSTYWRLFWLAVVNTLSLYFPRLILFSRSSYELSLFLWSTFLCVFWLAVVITLVLVLRYSNEKRRKGSRLIYIQLITFVPLFSLIVWFFQGSFGSNGWVFSLTNIHMARGSLWEIWQEQRWLIRFKGSPETCRSFERQHESKPSEKEI